MRPRTSKYNARRTKYNARRTWSDLCKRWFASAAEAHRADELQLRALAGDICGVEFQPRFVLRKEDPHVHYTADFRYWLPTGRDYIVEDVKGRDTRDSQVRRAWVLDKLGVRVQVLHAVYRKGRITGWVTL